MSTFGPLGQAISDQPTFERAATLAAHEMTGPLATAAAAIELLRSRLDPDDEVGTDLAMTAARHLRLAQLQTSRLGQLATDAPVPHLQATDLDRLARELVDDLALSALVHHPTTVCSPGAVVIDVDPDQIRQVLYNLLTNAAHYSPRGREIVVELRSEPGHLALRVRDQGHGVAPEATDRIFEPYHREHQDAPGLGLGLALSRDIARGHGGALGVEPAPKGGAVFLLTLPDRSRGEG